MFEMKDSETPVSHQCFIYSKWALEVKSPKGKADQTTPSHSSQGSVCKEGSCTQSIGVKLDGVDGGKLRSLPVVRLKPEVSVL